MTGFGAASGEGSGLVAQVEVRSVNHRYLQVKARIPSDFAILEQKVDALLRKRLERGSVSVTLNVRHTAARRASIDHEAARAYRRELTKLGKDLDLEGGVQLSTILSLPGVVAVDAGLSHSQRELKLILTTVSEAVEGLVEMREREGKALERDLLSHAAELEKLVAKIEKRMPQVVKGVQAGLEKRVTNLLQGRATLEPDALAREVAILADRSDVAEELSRLASHVEQIRNRIAKGGNAVGKQLDFLVQELVRELNTIGSKCSDTKVAHWVVEGKTAVERMREQVQNVE